MLLKYYSEVPYEIPKLEGTKGVTLRWLINKNDGAENYAMRLFEVLPNGIIPMHEHEKTEHEIFIVEGEGILQTPEKTIKIKQGDAIFVKPGEKHSFQNNSKKPFKFLCIIPLS